MVWIYPRHDKICEVQVQFKMSRMKFNIFLFSNYKCFIESIIIIIIFKWKLNNKVD